MSLSFEDVEEILRIIDSVSTKDFHLEVGDLKVVVRKRRGAGTSGLGVEPHTRAAVPRATPPTATCVALRAPSAGTFYRAPAPGATPFVRPGDMVDAGGTLCILDVMKVMTMLASPCAGRVVEITVSDADSVAADEVLIWIEPAQAASPQQAA